MKGANHAGRYIPSIILTLHPLVQSRIRTLRRPHLARQKSLILTAQTTRPLQRNDAWYISPRVICFLHVVLIKSRPSLTVFLLSSLRLSYFFQVAMVVGCSIAVTPYCIVESDPESVSDGCALKLATRPFLFRSGQVV